MDSMFLTLVFDKDTDYVWWNGSLIKMKSVLSFAGDSVVLHSNNSEMHFSSSIREEHS